MTSEDSEVTESVYEDMKTYKNASNPRRSRRKKMRKTFGSRERPKTATLPHPSILDETLKDKVDMTLTKKDLLAAVKLCNNEPGAHATIPTRWEFAGTQIDSWDQNRFMFLIFTPNIVLCTFFRWLQMRHNSHLAKPTRLLSLKVITFQHCTKTIGWQKHLDISTSSAWWNK